MTARGLPVTVSWETKDADHVEVVGRPGHRLPAQGSCEVDATAGQPVVLAAVNSTGRVLTRTEPVQVVDPAAAPALPRAPVLVPSGEVLLRPDGAGGHALDWLTEAFRGSLHALPADVATNAVGTGPAGVDTPEPGAPEPLPATAIRSSGPRTAPSAAPELAGLPAPAALGRPEAALLAPAEPPPAALLTSAGVTFIRAADLPARDVALHAQPQKDPL